MTRVALVSGGTRGIGAAISLALKEAGYQVAANYAGNDEAARQFSAEHGVPVFKWSVADGDACQAGVAKVAAEVGPIDILVNNAGITRDSSFAKMTAQHWRDVMATNLDSLFYMSKSVFDGMKQRKFGRIVTIGSVNGQKGQFGQANYAAAKAGAVGFTKALAHEGARANVTVNLIAPGYIATDMVKAVPQEVLNSKVLPQIPVGRLGEPDEIGRCVVFLASDQAGFITGSTLTANGGQYMI